MMEDSREKTCAVCAACQQNEAYAALSSGETPQEMYISYVRMT